MPPTLQQQLLDTSPSSAAPGDSSQEPMLGLIETAQSMNTSAGSDLSTEQRKHATLASLAHSAVSSAADAYLANIENNIAMAGLGWAAVLLEQHEKDIGNASVVKNMSLAKILQRHMPFLPPKIADMDDASFLRPLYLCGIVSPIVMLLDLNLFATTSDKHNQIRYIIRNA